MYELAVAEDPLGPKDKPENTDKLDVAAVQEKLDGLNKKIRIECPLLGKRVEITGTSREDLEGAKTGVVTSFDHGPGRYVVTLDMQEVNEPVVRPQDLARDPSEEGGGGGEGEGEGAEPGTKPGHWKCNVCSADVVAAKSGTWCPRYGSRARAHTHTHMHTHTCTHTHMYPRLLLQLWSTEAPLGGSAGQEGDGGGEEG